VALGQVNFGITKTGWSALKNSINAEKYTKMQTNSINAQKCKKVKKKIKKLQKNQIH
jgi:hypothetical protein